MPIKGRSWLSTLAISEPAEDTSELPYVFAALVGCVGRIRY